MADIAAMATKQAASRDSIIVQLLKLLLGLWSGFDRWDDVDAVTGMAARSASLVESANLRSRVITRTFQTAVLKELGAGKAELATIVNSYPRANTTPTEVYSRPVQQYIWARRNGLAPSEATKAFEQRLTDVATQDVKLADRDEAQRVLGADPLVDRWRRVPHPELSKSGTCGLCWVAAQRVYTVGTLMAMHGPSCNCTIMGISKGDDPGLRINDADLKMLYAAAGSNQAADLLNTRITVTEHGELGPVLVKEGDHFRTPEEAGRPAYVPQTPDTIRADRTRERNDLAAQLEHARARLDAMPDSVKFDSVGGTTPEYIAVFRAAGYMRQRIAQLETFLTNFTA